MDESQENDEVKTAEEAQASETAEQDAEPTKQAEDNSQPQQQSDPKETAAMLELEEILKGLEPDDVLKYQRELSAEMGENLFEGEIGDLFKKYKPQLTREQKVKSMASLLKSDKPAVESAKTTQQDEGIKRELLEAKIKLELISNGVSKDYLDDAATVAMAKIKDANNLDACKEIATRYSVLSKARNETIPTPPPRTSIVVGENKDEMSEGEKAVAFLKKRNPNGFK